MKNNIKFFLILVVASCNNIDSAQKEKYRNIGSIERLSPLLDVILDSNAKPEIIAEGFEWSEGPLWIEKHKMLLFSDVPTNTIYKWTEEKGKEIYLTPSGYTDSSKRGVEMGSNGLLLDKDGNLVLCQHGNRQMARMDAPLDNPVARYVSIANSYNGKKFNSPNDATYNSNGELFFTDPPYGLENQLDDTKKEIPFQGVYKVAQDGKVILMTDSLTRPNGIAFLPGEKILLVANSDPDKPYWYAIDADTNDSSGTVTIFHSAESADESLKGLPDGLKADKKGNVFATGPGGIWIFNSKGKLLGKIKLEEAASNVALSADERTLYITNDMYVLRLKMR